MLSYRFIEAWPEYGQDIYGSHGRGEVIGNRLHIEEQLRSVMLGNHWDPGHAYSNQKYYTNPENSVILLQCIGFQTKMWFILKR